MVYALKSTCIFLCISGLHFLSPTHLGCPIYARGCLRWSYQHATRIQIVPVSDPTNVCAFPPETQCQVLWNVKTTQALLWSSGNVWPIVREGTHLFQSLDGNLSIWWSIIHAETFHLTCLWESHAQTFWILSNAHIKESEHRVTSRASEWHASSQTHSQKKDNRDRCQSAEGKPASLGIMLQACGLIMAVPTFTQGNTHVRVAEGGLKSLNSPTVSPDHKHLYEGYNEHI